MPWRGFIRGLITAPLTVSYLIIAMGLLITFNELGIPKSLLTIGIGHVVINRAKDPRFPNDICAVVNRAA